VSSAPFGSASVLVISWAYIKMLGGLGLADSSKIALLNANYIAHRLAGHYTLRFKNVKGRVAHELLIDLAEFDKSAGLKVTDFAKRLQDYSFHPPTCSWPISTCMLIEPTESETLEELDRFCDAMIMIRQEVQEIIDGKQPGDNNVLKNAPHPAHIVALSEEEWKRPYSRFKAAYPMPYLFQRKCWPTISRIDDAYGDTNLIVCSPPSLARSTTDETSAVRLSLSRRGRSSATLNARPLYPPRDILWRIAQPTSRTVLLPSMNSLH
jgi:glycine dehydrogenase